jgi:TRAP-type C4-dicarboxylate transport system substrate-binding protein
MSTSRRQVFRIGAGAVAASVAMPWVARAQSTVKWDLSTVWPESNFHTQNCKIFAEEVKKATGGAVEITVKAGGQLGFKGPEHLRAVRDGLVPIADILNVQQVGDEPLLGVEGVPFLVGDFDELKILHKHVRPAFETIATRNNQSILYMVPWPTQYLHLKIKAETVEALKGIKIRVPDKNSQDLTAAIGMAPALIPWGETIPALASGAVAGVSTSSVSGVDGKFWEFLKFFHRTNHQWSSQIVNVNVDAWKKLSPAHQSAIKEVSAKLEPQFWAVSQKADTDAAKRLTEGGMQMVTPPAAMMADMRQKTATLLDAFMKRVSASEKPIKAFLAEVKRA